MGTGVHLSLPNYSSDYFPMTFSEQYCCVCGKKETIPTQCLYGHNICKICYLSILQICYCENKLGEIVYKCPLCRYEHKYTNGEMNNILLILTEKDNTCIRVHKLCENRNITKKCRFEKCGCRENIVDIIVEEEIDLAIKDIIHVANKYSDKYSDVGAFRTVSPLNRVLQKEFQWICR